MRYIKVIGLIFLSVWLSASAAKAADLSGNWGGGVFGSLYRPFFKFRDMYTDTGKFGVSVHHMLSPRKLMEVEYHYAKFSDGSLEERTFRFADGKDHRSPQASSDMTFNSISVNWLLALKQNGFGQGGAPYITFGTGFYDYANKVSGLIYPEQKPSSPGAPPDPAILLEPVEDTRTALSINVGGGTLFFFSERASLDLRVRYNFVLGELRPFAVWGIQKTSFFHLLDVGAGLKFYISGE